MKYDKIYDEFFQQFFYDIGEDSYREGLKRTPNRVIESWKHLYSGYDKNPIELLQNSLNNDICDEMIVLKNVEFYSMCEHHILPFFGEISIGYIPDKKLVGISKLAQLVEIYSHRLQIQERFTTQIADTIMQILEPKGVMVVAKATHLCMIMQGVEKKSSHLITSAVRGRFKQDARSRAEFMEHIK